MSKVENVFLLHRAQAIVAAASAGCSSKKQSRRMVQIGCEMVNRFAADSDLLQNRSKQLRVQCRSSFQRKMVHLLADLYGLDHTSIIDYTQDPHLNLKNVERCHCHNDCRRSLSSATPKSEVQLSRCLNRPSMATPAGRVEIGDHERFRLLWPDLSQRIMDMACWPKRV